ncbi:tyrosine-protein phosphatase [Aurantimonas endophytica]|uniref:protein-tyrosine-phosphatase n=1 Tax=Aurantimonas endophytica TaxID=1522175 RepID=A0A7W6MRA6_9HYPH|nr:CpsB/CapC family capsule biosynthesis tyrosine phosphatase [Aurantimonas endophytica]MBB4004835.1 protein-tyrosine phosphatase [Aurantimonas endophytica]MCO6405645.1 capsular biosynthesis protein [Aurantimonas endophytica]
MIDLHSHILSGVDDGAETLAMSIAMARLAVDDGVTVMACTPHIVPGLYMNHPREIARRVAELSAVLEDEQIPLRLIVGADVHIAPGLLDQLSGNAPPTLNRSRYFLLEPSLDVLPPRFVEFCGGLIAAGFVPIITHPERLAWVAGHYGVIRELAESGILMQLTAGSLTGDFGRSARVLAERMLDEGFCDIIASDAHGVASRRPGLSKARAIVAERLGEQEAENVVLVRPRVILENGVVERPSRFGGARDVAWQAAGHGGDAPFRSLVKRMTGA